MGEGQNRSIGGCSKLKSPETRQVQERFVSTLEHLLSPHHRTLCPHVTEHFDWTILGPYAVLLTVNHPQSPHYRTHWLDNPRDVCCSTYRPSSSLSFHVTVRIELTTTWVHGVDATCISSERLHLWTVFGLRTRNIWKDKTNDLWKYHSNNNMYMHG